MHQSRIGFKEIYVVICFLLIFPTATFMVLCRGMPSTLNALKFDVFRILELTTNEILAFHFWDFNSERNSNAFSE